MTNGKQNANHISHGESEFTVETIITRLGKIRCVLKEVDEIENRLVSLASAYDQVKKQRTEVELKMQRQGEQLIRAEKKIKDLNKENEELKRTHLHLEKCFKRCSVELKRVPLLEVQPEKKCARNCPETVTRPQQETEIVKSSRIGRENNLRASDQNLNVQDSPDDLKAVITDEQESPNPFLAKSQDRQQPAEAGNTLNSSEEVLPESIHYLPVYKTEDQDFNDNEACSVDRNKQHFSDPSSSQLPLVPVQELISGFEAPRKDPNVNDVEAVFEMSYECSKPGPFLMPQRVTSATSGDGKFRDEGPSLQSLSEDAPLEYMDQQQIGDIQINACEDCSREDEGTCPIHTPLTVVQNIPFPMDGSDPERSFKTVPDFLRVGPSSIDGAGRGVFALQDIAIGVSFGPYEGVMEFQEHVFQQGYAWQISQNGNLFHLVDGQDPARSNWLRYVNGARNQYEQNLVAFLFEGEIYYRTFKEIPKGRELLVHYESILANDFVIQLKQYAQTEASSQESPVITCYQCDICQVYFSCQNVLRGHRKQHGDRTGLKKHKCQECIYSTDNMDHLRQHIRTHTKEKPYACDVCDRAFTQSGSLRQHKRTHTKEKPYKCQVCYMAFTDNSTLRSHKMTHTQEKHYVCHMCNKVFARPRNLRLHQKTHTKEKPYMCYNASCKVKLTKGS